MIIKSIKNVSVIIPVYNGYKWASGIIKSLTGNTNSVDELILVNDGDVLDFLKLSEMLHLYFNFPIIVVHTLGREGPAVARNIGIEYAKNEYIAFLDCDDIWLAGSLGKRVDILVNNPDASYSYCSFQYISEQGYLLNIYHVPKVTKLCQLLVTNYNLVPTLVIRREVLGNKRFPLMGHEDYGLLLDLLTTKSAYAIGLDEVGCQIRVVSDSISSNKKQSIIWHWTILKNYGLPVNLRSFLFIGYAVNGLLKRKLYYSRPIFFGLDFLANIWLKYRTEVDPNR